MIITGSNAGLGKETARVLASHGAEIIMAVRSLKRGLAAAEHIKQQLPAAKLTVMECDLSCLASVKRFADAFKKTGKQCHVLMANAGIEL